jgi:hypothetical protein
MKDILKHRNKNHFVLQGSLSRIQIAGKSLDKWSSFFNMMGKRKKERNGVTLRD